MCLNFHVWFVSFCSHFVHLIIMGIGIVYLWSLWNGFIAVVYTFCRRPMHFPNRNLFLWIFHHLCRHTVRHVTVIKYCYIISGLKLILLVRCGFFGCNQKIFPVFNVSQHQFGSIWTVANLLIANTICLDLGDINSDEIDTWHWISRFIFIFMDRKIACGFFLTFNWAKLFHGTVFSN